MKCPECVKDNKKSVVSLSDRFRTAAGFHDYYDEEGKHHVHDSNTTSTRYSCSNGHRWEVVEKGRCWCGWPNGERKQ